LKKARPRKPIKLTEFLEQAQADKGQFEAGQDLGEDSGQESGQGAGEESARKEAQPPATPLIGILDIDLSEVKKRLGAKNSDVVYREFVAGGCDGVPMAVVFIDGMVDKTAINDGILKTLLVDVHKIPPEAREGKRDPHQWIKSALLAIGEVKDVSTIDEVIDAVLAGDAPILVDGMTEAIVTGVKGWPTRSISEPDTEAIVRGPREGFTETLRVNTALIRHRLKSPDLRVDPFKVGERTKTDVALLYIKGLADERLIREAKSRITAIKVDGILDAGYLEQYIEDQPFSPFPQIGNTERPDRVVGFLLEGRLAIIVDGSPFALVIPSEMNTFMQSPEDYYDRPYTVLFLRVIRAIASIGALLLPSLYVAVTTFHPELLPTPLALSIAAGREGKPFPPFIEALLMEFVFETLREAGVRLPRPFGQAVGIVGAIVIGQASVTAGLVSPLLLIIVSLTAVATFAFPSFLMANSIRLVRFPLMLLAAVSGLYGIVWGLIFLTVHLMTLRSFGVPYFFPWAPTSRRAILSDTLIRAPLWSMRRRPDIVRPQDPIRQKKGMKPGPRGKGGTGTHESGESDE